MIPRINNKKPFGFFNNENTMKDIQENNLREIISLEVTNEKYRCEVSRNNLLENCKRKITIE
jgi:hypothetical protein